MPIAREQTKVAPNLSAEERSADQKDKAQSRGSAGKKTSGRAQKSK